MRTLTVTVVSLLFCLLNQCLGVAVEGHFRLFASHHFLPHGFVEYPDVTRMSCIGHCAKHPDCHYANYQTDNRTCILLSTSDDGVASHNWYLYGQIYCPVSLDDFTTVGNYSLAICSTRVQKSEAESACAKFGVLLEIRTELMFQEIHSYLMSLPPAMVDLYDDSWVSGEYNETDGTWRLPDGGLLPLTNATVYDMDGSSSCVQLDPGDGYLFDDKACDAPNSYICERQ